MLKRLAREPEKPFATAAYSHMMNTVMPATALTHMTNTEVGILNRLAR